jgi:hypothetical protein
MGAVAATDAGIADAGIITDGTEDAVITNGVTIAATTTTSEVSLSSLFVIPIARTTREWQRRERSRREARPVRCFRRRLDLVGAQPSPISTAIRIRSEWFLAPSFCFSSEVVLATVL